MWWDDFDVYPCLPESLQALPCNPPARCMCTFLPARQWRDAHTKLQPVCTSHCAFRSGTFTWTRARDCGSSTHAQKPRQPRELAWCADTPLTSSTLSTMPKRGAKLPKKMPSSSRDMVARWFIVNSTRSHLYKGSPSAPNKTTGEGNYKQDQ